VLNVVVINISSWTIHQNNWDKSYYWEICPSSYMVKRIIDPPVLIEQLNPCGNFIAVAGRWLGG